MHLLHRSRVGYNGYEVRLLVGTRDPNSTILLKSRTSKTQYLLFELLSVNLLTTALNDRCGGLSLF